MIKLVLLIMLFAFGVIIAEEPSLDFGSYTGESVIFENYLSSEDGFLAIEKVNGKIICVKGKFQMLSFVEIDSTLTEKQLSSIRFYGVSKILNYQIIGDTISLILHYYQKSTFWNKVANFTISVLYDYRNNKVISSENVYAIIDPSDYDDYGINKKNLFSKKDNKEQILINDFKTNKFAYHETELIKISHNKKTGSVLLYHLLEADNENLEVYYSIIDKYGHLLKCERTVLSEKAFDTYKEINGIFAEINNDNTPIFYIDFKKKNERFISSFAFSGGTKLTAKVAIPLEVNDETDYYISSTKQANNGKIFGVILEEKDIAADAYGIFDLDLSNDLLTLKYNSIIWTDDEIDELTDDNELRTNLITDARYIDGFYYLILDFNFNLERKKKSSIRDLDPNKSNMEKEANRDVNEFIQHSLGEALLLKLDSNFKKVWHHYIENRRIVRDLTYDESRLFYPEPRFGLKFSEINNKEISFYYQTSYPEYMISFKTINNETGKMKSDLLIMKSSPQIYFYPELIINYNESIIMDYSWGIIENLFLQSQSGYNLLKFKLKK